MSDPCVSTQNKDRHDDTDEGVAIIVLFVFTFQIEFDLGVGGRLNK